MECNVVQWIVLVWGLYKFFCELFAVYILSFWWYQWMKQGRVFKAIEERVRVYIAPLERKYPLGCRLLYYYYLFSLLLVPISVVLLLQHNVEEVMWIHWGKCPYI